MVAERLAQSLRVYLTQKEFSLEHLSLNFHSNTFFHFIILSYLLVLTDLIISYMLSDIKLCLSFNFLKRNSMHQPQGKWNNQVSLLRK